MLNVDLRNGDCLEVLKTIPDDSVDSIVTDPPYGLSFMNKKWDYDVPSTDVWKECLRVLKPGGHLLAFAGTRTQHRMAVRIEDAGFEIRDMIAWAYGSGFPKSMDVSKAIDKRLGAERKILSERKRGTGFDPNGEGGGGFKRGTVIVSEPATELSKEWEGWGTSLKPAIEPITVARKPLVGTVADNVLAHGTGAINIDGCRAMSHDATETARTPSSTENTTSFGKSLLMGGAGSDLGRFPANLIHDGSDEVVSLFPESMGAGGSLPQVKITGYGVKIGNGERSYFRGERIPFDSGTGSAARFFNSCQFDDEDLESIPLIYCAKASTSDRETGLADFPIRKAGSLNMRTDKHSEENGQTTAPRANIHPTVKPTALMRHLIRLVTPPGGTTLDPFTGSGTTGKAAMLEGMNFVGIELSPEYFEIASKRILHARDNKSCYDEAGRVVNEKQSTPSSVSIEEVFG